MKTLISGLLLTLASVAAGATFDQATGVGSVTQGEIQAAFGWTPAQYQANAMSFTACYSDNYDVTVKFTNASGATVIQPKTAEVRTYRTVTRKQTAGGFDFTGLGAPNTLSQIPQVGGGHVFFDGGKQITGTIISAAYSNTTAGVVVGTQVSGAKQIYP